MTPPSQTRALRSRWRRRRSDRGAIVFIVAMTTAVLASLGLFALVAASQEVKTAGYERQNVQQHYLAESGLVAANLQVTLYGDGAILPFMRTTPGAGQVGDYNSGQPRNQCWSLESVKATSLPPPDTHSQECKIMNYRPPLRLDLMSPFRSTNGFNATGFSTWPALGTYTSPVLAPTTFDAEIRVEVTDPVAGSTILTNATAGQAQQTVRACTVTVTTYGETLPQSGTYGAAGLEVGRARITFLSYGNNCQ
jgi:hypothetical protein